MRARHGVVAVLLAVLGLAGAEEGGYRSHAMPAALPSPGAASSYEAPAEPDYEAEKLQFQRGSLLYYTLPDSAAPQPDLDTLQRQARADDAHAQLRLGMLSEQGRGLPQDYHAARESYLKAAPQSADASFLLGLIYYQGKGVPQDFAQAWHWFEQAASQGSSQAQVNLGWMCEYGQGRPDNAPDPACARRWYGRAADAGDALGMFNLGTQYYLGKGVVQDYAQARHWFLLAAGKNHPAAQYNLGVMALGQGADRNPVEAYRWFRLAQSAFYPGSGYNLERIAGALSAAQKAQAEKWVRQWQADHAGQPQ